MRKVSLVSVISLIAGNGLVSLAATPEETFFIEQVRPVLEAKCVKCHGGEKIRGGLRLLSRETLLVGSDLGPVFNPDKPDDSLLLKMISYDDDDHQMPPRGKLPQEARDAFHQWFKSGAPWPEDQNIEGHAVPERDRSTVSAEDRNWWAYRPVASPVIAQPSNPAWKHPIDALILSELEKNNLKPVGAATKSQLIRRAYFDLIGLPPTPEQVDAFVADSSANAWENVIDELLASPHYGEKWGRHWLDLVRYAESNGYERDSTKTHIWRYRDYVIKAFNENKPYDVFIKEQLAGDEMPNAGLDQLAATGYYRLPIWDDEPADRLQAKYDVIDDILLTTTESILGMTVGCARCHDHKIDPIPQKDYYRLMAFFHNITNHNKGGGSVIKKVVMQSDAFEKNKAEREAKTAQLHADIFKWEQAFQVKMAEESGQKFGEGASMTDVRYRFYRDTWSKLPDFDNLKAETEGTLSHNFFDLAPASRNEAVGFVFEGRLVVPADGDYGFHVDGCDGVRLSLNGKTLIDHDGLHRMGKPKSRGLALKKGVYPIRLDYFNKAGNMGLKVVWTGPGFKRPLSLDKSADSGVYVADSRSEGQTWYYRTIQPEGKAWMMPEFNDAKGWKKGVAGFGAGNPPASKMRTSWKTKDIWLRKVFNSNVAPSSLELILHHDEDVVVYLNGAEIYKATGYLRNYSEIKLPAQAAKHFRNGANVLAVHCKQTGGGQYIDLGLKRSGGKPGDLAQLIKQHGTRLMGKLAYGNYQKWKQGLKTTKVEKPAGAVDVMCITEPNNRAPDTFLMIRGSAHALGDKVEPGFPQVTGGGKAVIEVPEGINSSGRRTAIANWITQADNPLTSRVIVNRIWQHLFGRGIVRSTNNFGKSGDLPTHPELLDWLAKDFVTAKSWHFKPMIKEIMLTQAYQMSSKAYSEALYEDPRNNAFWRQNMRRLTAEEVRDSMLKVSGSLNVKMAGPSFYPDLPAEVLATASNHRGKWGKSPMEEQNRRSVYIFVRRSILDPLLSALDLADTDRPCAVRFTTTVPTQSLIMMNGQFVNGQAVRFADSLRSLSHEPQAQVAEAIRIALSRQPRAGEVAEGLTFMKTLQQEEGLRAEDALNRFALVLLNLNEFIYLD